MPRYYVVSAATEEIIKVMSISLMDDLAINVGEGELVTPEDPTKDPSLYLWNPIDGYRLKPQPEPDPNAPVWMSKFDYLLLWTATEMVAVKLSNDPDMVRAFMLLNAWEGPINLLDSDVQAGIARAEFLEILTPERAARIAAGLPPL